jgi:hypothetical protein
MSRGACFKATKFAAGKAHDGLAGEQNEAASGYHRGKRSYRGVTIKVQSVTVAVDRCV